MVKADVFDRCVGALWFVGGVMLAYILIFSTYYIALFTRGSGGRGRAIGVRYYYRSYAYHGYGYSASYSRYENYHGGRRYEDYMSYSRRNHYYSCRHRRGGREENKYYKKYWAVTTPGCGG